MGRTGEEVRGERDRERGARGGPTLGRVTDDFRKPVLFGSSAFESFQGGDDPAQISRVAHETANALINRVRETPDEQIVQRLVAFTDEHGIDAIAELWSRSAPRSLPGSLWRLYLLRALIRQDPEQTSFTFTRGTDLLRTIDAVVAGAETPTGPKEVTDLADRILRGVFTGDFAVALDRAAAFCRIMAQGWASLADDAEVLDPDRGSELTTRAARFEEYGGDLAGSARLWRSGSLE